MRNGDDTKGSTGLRVPRRRKDEALPLAPVPALLPDCGVVSKFCTARLKPENFVSLAAGREDCAVRRPADSSVRSSAGVSGALGELRPEWYDIACDSACGGLVSLWGPREAAQPTRMLCAAEVWSDRQPYDEAEDTLRFCTR